MIIQFGTISYDKTAGATITLTFPMAFTITSYGFCAMCNWFYEPLGWFNYTNVTESSIDVTYNGFNRRAQTDQSKYIAIGY